MDQCHKPALYANSVKKVIQKHWMAYLERNKVMTDRQLIKNEGHVMCSFFLKKR